MALPPTEQHNAVLEYMRCEKNLVEAHARLQSAAEKLYEAIEDAGEIVDTAVPCPLNAGGGHWIVKPAKFGNSIRHRFSIVHTRNMEVHP